jgi:hypothetical protein
MLADLFLREVTVSRVAAYVKLDEDKARWVLQASYNRYGVMRLLQRLPARAGIFFVQEWVLVVSCSQ